MTGLRPCTPRLSEITQYKPTKETAMNAFEAFAEKHKVTLQAQAIPFRADGEDGWDKEAVHFAVRLFVGEKEVWRGEYSVGSAHPMRWALSNKAPYAARVAAKEWAELSRAQRATVHYSRLKANVRNAFEKAAPIHASSVLESLQADCSGVDQPFEYWAADMGFDPDSRKAFSSYQQCDDTRKRLLGAMGGSMFEAFMELRDE